MGLVQLTDRKQIATFLGRQPAQHLYAIGDLDDFFWPDTTWYGWEQDHQLLQIVLLYQPPGLAVLLAISDPPESYMHELLRALAPQLPPRLYSHLSPGLETIIGQHYRLESHGLHLKMVLSHPEQIHHIATDEVEQLGPIHATELIRFYDTVYPGNWFDPRMLETGQYMAIREQQQLISVAGIHVYSPSYRVAALGNITTHPAARGRGLASKVTAALCQQLLRHVDLIGLNVRADNHAAIACYHKLGFTTVIPYHEYTLEAYAHHR